MKYVLTPKPHEVEAKQWLPWQNKRVVEVMNWLASLEVDARFEDTVSVSVLDAEGGRKTAQNGDWLVLWEQDSRMLVVPNEVFAAQFTPA